MIEYIAFGEVLTEEELMTALPESVVAVIRACARTSAFTVLEQRRWSPPDPGPCDVVVVDCINDQVPTRNSFGVRPREQLALVLPRDPSKLPQVRALRRDFPCVMHLNLVPRGEPASLCLYFEPWAHTRRSWTAERFLQRILFWLTETAKGTLHRPDQPLEVLYFEPPIDVVMPPNWQEELNEQNKMLFICRVQGDEKRHTYRAMVVCRDEVDLKQIRETFVIRVCINAIVHGGVAALPATLGDLAEGLAARGSELLEPLRDGLARVVGSSGVAPVTGQRCLLLLSIPTMRSAGGDVERVDVRGFLVPLDLATLGIRIGALTEIATKGLHYPDIVVGAMGNTRPPSAESWRGIPVVSIAVRNSVTRKFSRSASAVPEEKADEKHLLAGLGALGSQLVDLWSREGWGVWTLIDPDFVQPHNVVRHLARDADVGRDKTEAVSDLIDALRPLERKPVAAFCGDVLTTSSAKFTQEIQQATLIVDATTTLEVPRELSHRDDVARCVSVFLTPSGRASVMLFEDEPRGVRLDELEAQYYKAILAADWGREHLAGHQGELWVGAGCRDISAVLSNELVQLHSSILARQVRLSSSVPVAKIRIWIADDVTSEVRAVDVPVQEPIRQKLGAWTVVSHAAISVKLNSLRAEKLPAETGGVILGYIDHPLKRIFVVDVLPAPSDSEGTPTGFVRGVDGLAGAIRAVGERTAGIVGYLGEWHSHPPLHTPRPSGDDINLLAHCATVLARDGLPALMIIVGRAGEISYSLDARGNPSASIT